LQKLNLTLVLCPFRRVEGLTHPHSLTKLRTLIFGLSFVRGPYRDGNANANAPSCLEVCIKSAIAGRDVIVTVMCLAIAEDRPNTQTSCQAACFMLHAARFYPASDT